MSLPREASYPLSFRRAQSQQLGELLRSHTSVVLMGIKRVGISNFLRFFLNHPQVTSTYIANGPTLFVTVDLNNLVETKIPALWMLTLKRLVDAVASSDLPDETKDHIQHLFVDSMQMQDPFFTFDSIHKVVEKITAANKYLVIIFVRFDRLIGEFTQDFFANLQGLRDVGGTHLSYIFTSSRPLPELAPQVFTKASLAVFARDMYLQPAERQDLSMILATLVERYELSLSADLREALLDLAGGHVQYLQLSLIKLKHSETLPRTKSELIPMLLADEQVTLLSEEIFATLTKEEQLALQQLRKEQRVTGELPAYLMDSGLVIKESTQYQVFNPLFASYVDHTVAVKKATSATDASELTKKEQALFDVLKLHLGEVVDRDTIIAAVWPDEEEFGVTDWAVDRLVARLRLKLKSKASPYSITTVISRGYKLIELPQMA